MGGFRWFSISILVERGAILTGILLAIAGRENIAIAQATGCVICASAVSLGVIRFLGPSTSVTHLIPPFRWHSFRNDGGSRRFESCFTAIKSIT